MVEGGITAASWSPEGELLAIITNNALLLLFNKVIVPFDNCPHSLSLLIHVLKHFKKFLQYGREAHITREG